MRRLAALLLVGGLVVFPGVAYAQTGTITGQAMDEGTGQPLIGALVFVSGTTLNAVTNSEGRYRIPNVPPGTYSVVLSLIGYVQGGGTVNVAAEQTATLDFRLRVSAVALEGVVVSVLTGQMERKRSLGTNTASISSADLDRAPLTRMSDVLVGRAAGVTLQAAAGTIGTSQRIRIRGANSISLSNEPLIFVDGILVSNNKGGFAVGGQDYSRLNDINPEEIENIEILKGPAASAIYGTAAANGVVLITTRRGRSGPAQWRGYVEYGTSKDNNEYPTNYLPMQVNNASLPALTDLGRVNTSGYAYCPNESAARNVCRQDQVLSLNVWETAGLNPLKDGERQKVGLSVGGGGEGLLFYLSGDYDKETGVIPFNEQDRTSIRGNITARVSDQVGVNLNAAYVRTKLTLNSNDNNIFSPIINAFLATPFVPTAAQREAGGPGLRSGTGFGYYLTDIAHLTPKQLVDRFLVGGSADWHPVSWLSLNANIGLDYFGRFDQQTLQPGRLPIAATYTPGFREGRRNNNYLWTMSGAAVVPLRLTDAIASTTTFGTSFSREQFENVYCYGVGIVEGTRSCSAASSLFTVAEEYSQVRTMGGYVQQAFSWHDRRFLSLIIRGDDDSAFGKDFGFIYYPGASASWVVSEEPFFPQVDALSSLRLRGAYGRSGQRPGPRDAVTLLDPVSATVSSQELSAVRLRSVGNANLKPERTTEYEFGIDAGLLRDRLGVEIGYYNKQSHDALIARELPPSHGLTGDHASSGVIWDNLGQISNSGLEYAVNANVLDTRQAQLNVRVIGSTLKNEIVEMGENVQPIIFNRGTQAHKEGRSAGGFFAPQWEIVNPSEHRLLTRDDVRLVVDTAVFMGPSLPTNQQSLSADLSLFNRVLRISTLFERRAGHYTINYSEWFRCSTAYSRAGTHTGNGNCPGVGDPNASVVEQARFIAGRLGAVDPANSARRITSLSGYIEPADFIKWRELSVTVSAPQSLANRTRLLRGASVTVSGRNLARWTDYTGIDPEINESGGGSNFTQGEFNTQPPLRYFLIRMNVNF